MIFPNPNSIDIPKISRYSSNLFSALNNQLVNLIEQSNAWQPPNITPTLPTVDQFSSTNLPSNPNQSNGNNTLNVGNSLPNSTSSSGDNPLVSKTFNQFLINDKKPYALNAKLGVHTNCILAVEEFLKGALTPEQIAKIDRTQLVSDSKILEEAIAGAPGALHKAGIVGELVKFRGGLKNEQEKLAYIQNFASQINKIEGALIKTDKVSKPAGHEAVATNFKVIKDSSGNITDVTWQDISTRAPGSEGLSKKIFSLRKDFLDTGDRFTFGILKPEIIAQIKSKYGMSSLSQIA